MQQINVKRLPYTLKFCKQKKVFIVLIHTFSRVRQMSDIEVNINMNFSAQLHAYCSLGREETLVVLD